MVTFHVLFFRSLICQDFFQNQISTHNLLLCISLVQAADREEVTSGWIRSEGDLFMNGAQPCLIQGAGVERVFDALEHYPTWTMEPASVALKEVLQLCTGWQALQRPADWQYR